MFREKKKQLNMPNPDNGNSDSFQTEGSAREKNSVKNNQILYVSYFFVALFLVMGGYLCYFVATSEQDMINNSYNSRQEMLISQNYRGTIYSKDGDKLAYTQTNEDGSETRIYPYGNLFAHSVGYSTNGRTGIEALANYYLINSNAPLSDKVVNDMAGIKNPGDSVYSTLDVNLQQVASKALGVYYGAIIVTEPSTGKILAMVSKPDFDPNEILTIWDSLLVDTESSILLNRVTQGLYPPGSTFKIITSMEYIRENPDTYHNYAYQCNGRFTFNGNTIKCYHGSNHGSVNLIQSFAKSCNSSYANIGVGLDRTRFADTLKDLQFGKDLPWKLEYRKSSVSISEESDTDEIMQTSIGQGKTQISPLHLNMITSAIANGGVSMKPYMIEKVTNYNGNMIKEFKPDSNGRMMTEEEAEILKEMMWEVVKTGTGKVLNDAAYTSAGKTGSAEFTSGDSDSHAWFTGFAPVEDPQVCVTVIVEQAGSGGDYAVPMAKRIFNAYFEGK